MTDEERPTPKIIVDEDWKSQVQAEKEALAGKKQEEKATPTKEEPQRESPPLPPASFSLLVTTLAAQAMAALGRVPDPVSGKIVVEREHAKHFIDMLEILQQKTRGNLTEEESAALEDILHQLRLIYVSAATA